MDGEIPLRRRHLLKATGAGVLGATQWAESGAATATADDTIYEYRTATIDWDSATLRYTFEYELPSQVVEFEAQFEGVKWYSFLSVVETNNFDRQETDEGNADKFVWTGVGEPRLVLEDDLTSRSFEENPQLYYADEEVFSFTPESDLGLRYSGSEPDFDQQPFSFDGEGYATPGMVFAGSHELATTTVDGVDIAVVVPESVQRDINLETALDRLAYAEELVGNVRLTNSQKGAFILPEDRLDTSLGGKTVGGSLFVQEPAWNLDTVDNTPIHEFCHTAFGVFGTDEMFWLTEATAEYYGYLASWNAGIGDFEEFYDAVTVGDEDADVVLTDTDEVQSTGGNYTKGAHVLAAIDAEIREQTGSTKTLADIFQLGLLREYEEFESAVAEVTDNYRMHSWVGEYVTTSSLPDVPRDSTVFEAVPRFEVAGLESESISVVRGERVTVAADIKNNSPEAGTSTVSFLVDGAERATTQVDLGGSSSETVTFELDTSGFDLEEYAFVIQADGARREGTMSVVAPAAFEAESLDVEPASVTQGEPVTVTAEIGNTGGVAETAHVALEIETETGDERTLAEKDVEIEKRWSKPVTFSDVELTDVGPGEHTLRVRVGDTEREISLTVSTPTSDDASPTDTSQATGTATGTEQSETDDSDGSGPGFGLVSALAGLGGAGYLLKRRFSHSVDSEERD